MTWAGALRASSLGISASLLFLAIVGSVSGVGIDPFIVVIGLLFAFGSIWQSRWRGGSTFIAVISLLWFAVSILLGGYKALARPASWVEFVVIVASIAFPIVAVTAYRAGRRVGFDEPSSARLLPKAIGAVGLALVIGLVATFTAGSAKAAPGDLRIVAKAFAFDPSSLRAKAGRVAIFVRNDDPSHHDFTISGVVALQVPSFHARRASFLLQPGSYPFKCTLHPEEMKGTLTVA